MDSADRCAAGAANAANAAGASGAPVDSAPAASASAAPAARAPHVARAFPGRAKQFMPFATLRGYYDAVREQERESAPRRELQEEDAVRISRMLARLTKGTMVHIVYYDADAYVTLRGAVSEIVPELGWLSVVRTRIAFEDIASIEVLE